MKHLLMILLGLILIIIFPPILLVFLLEIGFQKKREKRKDMREHREIQYYARLNGREKDKQD